MKPMNRALIALKRELNKKLGLFTTSTILCLFSIISIILIGSISQNKDAIIKSMPALIQLVYRSEQEVYDENSDIDFEVLDQNRQYLTQDIIDKIVEINDELLSYYDYSIKSEIHIENHIKKFHSINESIDASNAMEPFNQSMNIMGIINPNLEVIELSQARIIEGRTLMPEELDSGSTKVIISKEFAELNGFTIGSTIIGQVNAYAWDEGKRENGLLPRVTDTLTIEFEVVGIIEYFNPATKTDYKENNLKSQYYRNLVSQVYTSSKVIRKINKFDEGPPRAEGEIAPDLDNYISYATFVLKDPRMTYSFIENAKVYYDDLFMVYQTQDSLYQASAAPLKSMQQLMLYVMIGSSISSIMIMALILLSMIKSRIQEIGTYLALGEKRLNIIKQLTIESLIINLLAATLALLIGYYLSLLVFKQIVPRDISIQPDLKIVKSIGTQLPLDYQTLIDSFKIKLTPISFIIYYTIIIFITLGSQVSSIVVIVKMQPKKILE